MIEPICAESVVKHQQNNQIIMKLFPSRYGQLQITRLLNNRIYLPFQ